MRVYLSVLAVLILGTLGAVAPAVGALDIGCQRTTDVSTLPAGTSTLFTPAGADVLGWTPECVIVEAGETVTFTQRDVIPHGAMRSGCFATGLMSLGGTKSVSVVAESVDADGFPILEMVVNGVPAEGCSDFAYNEDFTSVIIDYWCPIHGKQMPGKIIVEL